MTGQVFIDEIRCNFNLREPKADKPTNIYLVASINNKQVKLSTGVKVYPNQWNVKKQEAYISVRLTELDNINNTIVNNKLIELRNCFTEFKYYLCANPNKIENGITLLKNYIYKENTNMKEEKAINICLYLNQCVDKDTIGEGSKKVYTVAIKWLDRYIKKNNIKFQSFDEIDTKFFKGFQTFLLYMDNIKSVDGALSVQYINNTIKIIYQRLDAYAVGNGKMNRSKFLDIVPQLIKDKMDDYKIALRDVTAQVFFLLKSEKVSISSYLLKCI